MLENFLCEILVKAGKFPLIGYSGFVRRETGNVRKLYFFSRFPSHVSRILQ